MGIWHNLYCSSCRNNNITRCLRPTSIEHQKAAYARSLDAQLEQGTKMLEQQNEVQKQALRQAAEQQKLQYSAQVEQQLKAQEMSVDQQASYQLMGLQQAANAAVLDYEQKKVQDEFNRQKYEHDKKAYEKKMELHVAMNKHREEYAMKARAMQEAYAMQGARLQAEAAAPVGRDMPSYVAAPMAPASQWPAAGAFAAYPVGATDFNAQASYVPPVVE